MAHARGGCYVCLRGDRLVDLDVLIEGEGALVLCTGCISDAAQAAGLHLNAAAVAEVQAQHIEAERLWGPDRVSELEAEVAALRDKVVVDEQIKAHLTEALESRRRK